MSLYDIVNDKQKIIQILIYYVCFLLIFQWFFDRNLIVYKDKIFIIYLLEREVFKDYMV